MIDRREGPVKDGRPRSSTVWYVERRRRMGGIGGKSKNHTGIAMWETTVIVSS